MMINEARYLLWLDELVWLNTVINESMALNFQMALNPLCPSFKLSARTTPLNLIQIIFNFLKNYYFLQPTP